MDTGNDPRLAILDRALQDARRNVETGRLRAQFKKAAALEALATGHAALMVLRYAYQPAAELVEMDEFGNLTASADALEDALGGPGVEERIKEDALAVAQVAWLTDNLRSLEQRLALPGEGLELAVDARAGRVVSASKHPNAENLVLCRVAAGRPLRVVTNDASVRADETVGVALLPPVELRGIVSQGMFLGAGEGILRGVAPDAHDRPDVPPEAWAETRGLVAQYTGSK